ncbi:MAG: glycosyltransferase family 4 protein, partial [Cyanobium sp.]
TIQPVDGGVPSKLRWLTQELVQLGIMPILAWYEPWSRAPLLSVPSFALLSGRRPSQRLDCIWQRYEGHAIGCWLPELEFTHFLPGRHWQQLIRSVDLHLAVTGNPLCAYRFVGARVPFLAWIGSDWQGDRQDRVRRFPRHRRWLDRGVNAPILRKLERRVLRAPGGQMLTISKATALTLESLSGRPVAGVLYRPPDLCFRPEPRGPHPWRIGFSGRYSDPRKQLNLLLDAVVQLRAQGCPVTLELTGEAEPDAAIRSAISHRGLASAVRCHPSLSIEELAAVISGWDLFVIPSSQEGLCIAALEAMACAVPVVSTHCGGPEDFVIPDQTGLLVPHDPCALARAIAAICSDRQRRALLSTGALSWIEAHASQAESQRRLHGHLRAAFPRVFPDDI